VLVTGRNAEDVRDRPVADALPGWEAIAGRIPVAESGASAASVTLPVELDGIELWLSFVAVRSAEGIVYAFRDQTTEHRLEEAKSEFIATVSHELRTPMAGIYGAAQTLLREDVEFSAEDRRRLLEIVATQAVRLSQITEDVLVASRLERDELRVAREQVDVGVLASETIEAMRAQLPEVTTVELAVERKLEPAFGDRDRLQQVLVNLLDNAVKYSPDGGQVTVSVESSSDAVRLSVTDQGLGIPPAEQQRVFEKFYRLDTQLTRAGGGTGLGLYITRELVRRMGGTIGVRSEPGVGSTFTVDLKPAGAE
jgi:signal transduction histidine kinase